MRVGLDVHTPTHARLARRLLIGSLVLFAVHAVHYLYFFVDDEGIPLVFAKHLLEGRGFVYNSFEGRVEGYSNLLHVLMSAGWLLIGRVLGLSPLAPFFFGKLVSLACGLLTIVVTGRALARDPDVRPAGLGAGLAFLAFAPPLAQWSCSSLETAAAGLLVAIVACNLLDSTGSRDRGTAAAVCTLVLLRIDGFVHAAALIGPAWLMAGSHRGRELLRRVVLPLAATLAIYHAWRLAYFGDWISAPLAAKILYKLRPVHDIVRRPPEISYAAGFARVYGGGIALAAALLLLVGLRRARRSWPLVGSAAALIAYAALVGDWMTGFRFFVPVLPILAVLVGFAVSSLRRPQSRRAAAGLIALWVVSVTATAGAAYAGQPHRASWWRHPSLDPGEYFGQYMPLYEDLRGVVPAGSRIAYNQAGFVPYMLGADNLDDLGVCSRFVARLPTTDVVFTEVGRYSPLTNKPALRTANAYVLYRAPEFIVGRLDIVRSANGGRIPAMILRDHYERVLIDPDADAVVYRRAATSFEPYRSDPRVFLENVAHPSRLIRAYDGTAVRPGEFLERLPFLADGQVSRRFTTRLAYEVTFGPPDVPVYELHVNRVWSRTDVAMVLTLRDSTGATVRREERAIEAGHSAQVALYWPDGVPVSALAVEFEVRGGGEGRVIIRDVRVQGQPPALAAYVRQLPFPPHRPN